MGAFFTHFAAFRWPPHLSPGLAAAAEESPRKMQNSKVQGRAASGGLPQKNGPAAVRPRISCLDCLNSCLYWCSQKPRFPESFLAPFLREMGGFEAFSRAFCGLRRRFVALLRAFSRHFTTSAAFGWPPLLSPGLAAAAEESPRKMQNSKVGSLSWLCGIYILYILEFGILEAFLALWRAFPRHFTRKWAVFGGLFHAFCGFLPAAPPVTWAGSGR